MSDEDTQLPKQALEQFDKQVVICDTCGERMSYKINYFKEHSEKYPDHNSHRIILKQKDNY